MKKYKISYYYLATGMEGIADEYPEQLIIASNKELAAFIYLQLYFDAHKEHSFLQFQAKPDWEKYWGLTIVEE